MECQEAGNFVSPLHDGETVPKEAAAHIGVCRNCKERLLQYAQMSTELRLLAHTAPEDIPPLPNLPSRGWQWTRSLTARALVPRLALALGIVAVVGLSLGLVLMRAQSAGFWFQFDVNNPETQGSVGGLLQAGEPARDMFVSQGPHKWVAFEIRAPRVETDVVKLVVRARAIEPAPGSEEEKTAKYQAPMMPQVMTKILAGAPFQELEYKPGQTLEIPVEGGSKVLLSGQVYHLRPSFSAEWFPVTPKPDEIVLSQAALVRGNQFLGEVQGSGSARSENSAVGICVPELGAFVFALKPFDGAVQGLAEFGQVHFKMDGDEYTLFSATPITGGAQPREIWVYRHPNCPRSWPPIKAPQMIGTGEVGGILDLLR